MVSTNHRNIVFERVIPQESSMSDGLCIGCDSIMLFIGHVDQPAIQGLYNLLYSL